MCWAAPGAVILDGISVRGDRELSQALAEYSAHRIGAGDLTPDVWAPAILHEPSALANELRNVRSSRYSPRELDVFTDRIERSLQSVNEVTKVDRTQVVGEEVHLTFEPDRLLTAHLNPFALPMLLHDRTQS